MPLRRPSCAASCSINHGTRRITGSIQHVADVAPEELEAIPLEDGFGPLGTELSQSV